MAIQIIQRDDRGEIKTSVHEVCTNSKGVSSIYRHKNPIFIGIISIDGNNFTIENISFNDNVNTKAEIDKVLPQVLAYLKSYYTFKITPDEHR